MIRRPPRSPRTDTLVPDPTLFLAQQVQMRQQATSSAAWAIVSSFSLCLLLRSAPVQCAFVCVCVRRRLGYLIYQVNIHPSKVVVRFATCQANDFHEIGRAHV